MTIFYDCEIMSLQVDWYSWYCTRRHRYGLTISRRDIYFFPLLSSRVSFFSKGVNLNESVSPNSASLNRSHSQMSKRDQSTLGYPLESSASKQSSSHRLVRDETSPSATLINSSFSSSSVTSSNIPQQHAQNTENSQDTIIDNMFKSLETLRSSLTDVRNVHKQLLDKVHSQAAQMVSLREENTFFLQKLQDRNNTIAVLQSDMSVQSDKVAELIAEISHLKTTIQNNNILLPAAVTNSANTSTHSAATINRESNMAVEGHILAALTEAANVQADDHGDGGVVTDENHI